MQEYTTNNPVKQILQLPDPYHESFNSPTPLVIKNDPMRRKQFIFEIIAYQTSLHRNREKSSTKVPNKKQSALNPSRKNQDDDEEYELEESS